MKKKLKISLLDKLKKTKLTNIESQRKFVFSFIAIATIIASICYYFIFGGPNKVLNGKYYKLIIILAFLSTLSVSALVLYKKINIIVGITIMLLIMHAETSTEIIISSVNCNIENLLHISINISILTVLSFVPIVSQIKYLSTVVSAISIIIYLIVIYLTKSNIMADFLFMAIIIFTLIPLFGEIMIYNISHIKEENELLKNEKQEVMSLFKMNKKEFNEFTRLTKNKGLNTKQIEQILDAISIEAKTNIMKHAVAYVKCKQNNLLELQRNFPELTQSELEICGLIIMDKKQSEICDILKKSPGNITCQRTNIRKKLNLSKDDNLRLALLSRISK